MQDRHTGSPAFAIAPTLSLILALLVSSASAGPDCIVVSKQELNLFRTGGGAASAGDLDGDGYNDLLLGKPYGFTIETVSAISGRTLEEIHLFEEEGTTDQFGSPITAIGDLNSDGVPDILIRAANISSEKPASGIIYAHCGATGDLLYSITGDVEWEHFGVSISPTDDLTGDGVADYIAGSAWFNNSIPHYGKVTIVSGVDGSKALTISGDPTIDQLGWVVQALGDLNDDGFSDFAAGSYNGQRVKIFSGDDGSVIHDLQNPQPHEDSRFGRLVADGGDLNDDGYRDLLVGSPETYAGDNTNLNTTFAYSGATGELLFEISEAGLTYLYGLAGGKDLDGDGLPDIAIIQSAPSNERNLRVYSGADQTIIYEEIGTLYSDNFDGMVTMVDDINGDCLSELCVGSAYSDFFVYSFSNICERPTGCSGCCDLPGDTNDDNKRTIGDVTQLISLIFIGGAPEPTCLDFSDTNGDQNISIADVTQLISHMFVGGIPPVCGSTQ
jgi:hypothetical protein